METTIIDAKRARWISTARLIYWVITGFLAVTMAIAGILYLIVSPAQAEGVIRLGYPAYILKILGVAKLLGSVALVQDRSRTLKEWAYAGYTFNLIGAIASHAFTDHAFAPAIVVLCLLMVSYRQWKTGWM